MAYTIVDEIRLHNQASRLESLASKYDGIVNDIRLSCNELTGWDSNAGSVWRQKCHLAIAEASATASELRGIASSIRAFTANHHYLLEEAVETITGKVD